MALLRVNATRSGSLRLAAEGGDWASALQAALAALPDGAPICILIHGFRFTWRREVGAGCFCPHHRLYRPKPVRPTRRRRPLFADWPVALGFSDVGHGNGLCIGFGWDARERRASLSLRTGRDFAEIYDRAALAGEALARLTAEIARHRAGPVNLLAHSLGARVALRGLQVAPGAPFGRVVLLGAAEYRGEAARALSALDAASAGTEVFHMLSRANDLYDRLFQLIAPAPARQGDASLGQSGLGQSHPRWLDIQLDHPQLRPWLAARGCPLERPPERVSHWHFYADPGAMAFCRRILRHAPGYDIGGLRAAGLPDAIEPRWARLLPPLPVLPEPRRTADEPLADLTEV